MPAVNEGATVWWPLFPSREVASVTKFFSEQDAHEAAKVGSLPADAHLRKQFIAEIVKSDESDSRTLDFVISSESVDRYGDKVSVDGWKLTNYRRNPVVCWAHDTSMMPVAKASNIRIEDGKLKARAEFMPREISGFADAVFRAIKAGFLSACSVGFLPLKYVWVDEPERRFGIDFLEQELLEFSIVPVPALAEALIESRSAELDIAPFKEWALKLFGPDMALIPKTRLEAISALPSAFRDTAGKVPASAKGASGIWRRGANLIERAIKGEELEPHEEEPPAQSPAPTVVEEKTTPALDMARRRLTVIRSRT